MEKLLDNSPFSTAGAMIPTSGENTPAEFHGMVTEGNDRVFSVYSPITRRSSWLHVDESEGAITVRHFDDVTATLTIEYNKQVLILAMKRMLPPDAPAVAGTVNASSGPGQATKGGDSRAERRRKQVEANERRRNEELRLKDQISQQLARDAGGQP